MRDECKGIREREILPHSLVTVGSVNQRYELLLLQWKLHHDSLQEIVKQVYRH